MNCGYSKETLALYVEDDLPSPLETRKTEAHLGICTECRRYCEQLRNSQSFIRCQFDTGRNGSMSQEMLTGVRRAVMSQIEPVQRSLGWAIRLERFLLLGLRTPRYAAIGIAIVAIVSASLGQMRYANQRVLEAPSDYRQWVLVGSSSGQAHPPHGTDSYRNVYMSPAAYREYEHTGKFPEGTVMVLERLSQAKDFEGLQVSVKDSNRFEGGWGFYNFTNAFGKSDALPETAGCLSCHQEKAATDHVFTQFYSGLKL